MVLLLAAAAARAGTSTIMSYDLALLMDVPDGWGTCPLAAFAKDKAKPAFCLRKDEGDGPPPLLVMDLAMNQAYKPKVALKEIAKRDRQMRREKTAGEFTDLKAVKFREGLSGWGFGMKTADNAFDVFYFSVGAKSYYATCIGQAEQGCFEALKSIRAKPKR